MILLNKNLVKLIPKCTIVNLIMNFLNKHMVKLITQNAP